MLLKGIFWTNIKKHGFFKGTLGGYLMYPSVFMFFLFQIFFLRQLNRVVRIFQGTALNRKDYIDYGRVNLAEYSWFDRLNCHFCAYANGTTHMVSATLDLIGTFNIDALDENQKKQVSTLLKRAILWVKPVSIFSVIFVLALEKLLGYKRADIQSIIEDLKSKDFAKELKSNTHRSVYQNTFKLRMILEAFHVFLSTIESNWCPLTYANEKILLDHQKSFVSTNFGDVVSYINETKKNETMPGGHKLK